MINVATAFNTSRYALIGPSKNINRLYSNKNVFEEEGIRLIGPFCPNQGFTDAQEYQKSKSFGVKKRVKGILRRSYIGSLALFGLTNARLSRKVVREVSESKEPIDLIVFRESVTAYEYVKAGGGRPYVLVLHCDGTNEMMFSNSSYPKLKHGFGRKMLDDVFNTACENASGILFLSNGAIENFKKKGTPSKGVFGVYHQGVGKPDCRVPISVKADEGGLVFVTVGSICERKNQKELIEAFGETAHSASKLIVVGDGDQLEDCRRLAAELDIADRVIFTGALNNVGEALSVADVFVSASLDEGVPNAAVEAMSYGLPLLLTDVGFCSDLIRGNGILMRRPFDFVDGINAIMESDLNRMGERSLELYSRHYTIENMCREHATMYKRAMECAARSDS